MNYPSLHSTVFLEMFKHLFKQLTISTLPPSKQKNSFPIISRDLHATLYSVKTRLWRVNEQDHVGGQTRKCKYCKFIFPYNRAGMAQSVYRLATDWKVWGSNPGGGKFFGTRPGRPWGPPSLLYNGYRVFPGGKSAGVWRWPPTPSSAEVKERVQQYL